MTRLWPSRRTRIPVRTGRDSSREAARLDLRDRLEQCPVEARRQASPARPRVDAESRRPGTCSAGTRQTPHVIWSVDLVGVVLEDDVARRQKPHDLEQQRPGTTTAPSPRRSASASARRDISMSVAATSSRPPSVRRRTPARIWTDAARRDGTPNEPESAGELVAGASDLHSSERWACLRPCLGMRRSSS